MEDNMCRFRAVSPEQCGYTTWEVVKEKSLEYPHLRPCPLKNGWWQAKKACLKCEHRVHHDRSQ